MNFVFIFCLISCQSEAPEDKAFLFSSTHSDLGLARPLSVELQAGSEPLLVEIIGRDVNFSSRIFNSNGEIISEIHLAFLRSAPVYHFIEASAEPSRLTLEINPLQMTGGASVTINGYSLASSPRFGPALAAPWRELVRGLQSVDSGYPADWDANLLALENAQQQFKRLGLSEPALWAGYFRAYFEYYPLYRYSESLADVTTLIERSNQLNLPLLSLVGYQLAGQIRLEREASQDPEQARMEYQEAQENFNAALQLAQKQNNVFETIWAINNSGIAYTYQGQQHRALRRYGEAMDLAIEQEDEYLINLIGTNRAVAQQGLGQTGEALATLQRLQQELTLKDNPQEMENVLNLMGIYYLELYRFPRALEALNQALDLSIDNNWTENRGRNRLFLARAYRELGQLDKSREQLEIAIPLSGNRTQWPRTQPCPGAARGHQPPAERLRGHGQ